MTTRPLFDQPPTPRPKDKRIKPPAIPIIPPDPAQQWRITVTPFGDGPPAIIRVRRMLKGAYRGHKLRCIAIECVGDGGTPGNSTHDISSDGQRGPQTAANEAVEGNKP